MLRRFFYLYVATMMLFSSGFSLFSSGPKSDLDTYWAQAAFSSDLQVDHALWQSVLDDYLVEDDTGLNLFDYEGLQGDNDLRVASYVASLAAIDPLKLDQSQQKSYWINLYNALTVQLIVDHYPVESITELGGSLLSRGPWNDELLQVNGRTLTLNHIEHRILRPIFKDYRIHFAVNCASIGCPNLSPKAFTADNIEQLLTQLTVDYLNHPRAVRFDGDRLYLSSIFKWYREDFESQGRDLLDTISEFTRSEIAVRLREYQGKISFNYDWSLNGL